MLKNEGHLAVAAYPVDGITRSPGPGRTALLSPLFPLIAFFSFASFRAQIRRTPPPAFESTTPATHSRIRLLLQFEAFWSDSKPFPINNPGTFGLVLGLGCFLFFMSLSPQVSQLNPVSPRSISASAVQIWRPLGFSSKWARCLWRLSLVFFLFERFGCRFHVPGTRCWVLAAMGMVGFCTRRA